MRYLTVLLLLTGCVVPLGPQHFERPEMDPVSRQQDFHDCQYSAPRFRHASTAAISS